jgi:hypothetical protein
VFLILVGKGTTTAWTKSVSQSVDQVVYNSYLLLSTVLRTHSLLNRLIVCSEVFG